MTQTLTWRNPYFEEISFDLWSTLHDTKFLFPSNLQLTNCFQDFPYFLTTGKPPLFFFSPIVGTFSLLLRCVSTPLNAFKFLRQQTLYRATEPRTRKIVNTLLRVLLLSKLKNRQYLNIKKKTILFIIIIFFIRC